MLRVILSCLLFALAVAVQVPALSSEDYQYLYSKYLNQHNKVYDEDESAKRFAIFKSNLDIVRQHNAEAAEGKWSFTLGMNKFGDLDNAEYRKLYLNYKSSRQGSFDSEQAAQVSLEDLPASIDWRQKGAVSPVKNQAQCGSCWAFSATAALEGAYWLKHQQVISLSEQLCVDCANGGKDTCDIGGEMQECYEAVIALGGDELEKDYPYQATSGHACRFDKTKIAATFSSYVNVTSGSEAALQAASAVQPIVSVGIDASSIFFQLYSSGVYNDLTCKNGRDELDHGVAVVGYGTLNGKDYWIVRNSWGAFWGMQGYILMSRNKSNQCGIATDASYPIAN